jgi:dihydrofolate reductase
MKIEMVVAAAENDVIGKDGDMPWRMPSDLRHFKQVTMGHPIVMGRRTWQSIGRALPGRLNIVISRQADFNAEGAVCVTSATAALEQAKMSGAETLMIIGGGEIYAMFEAEASRIHLTRIHASPDGDTFFRLPSQSAWHETQNERFAAGETDSADYSFITLERG